MDTFHLLHLDTAQHPSRFALIFHNLLRHRPLSKKHQLEHQPARNNGKR